MNDQNKEIQNKESAPKSEEGAQAAQSLTWKRLLAKKWVYPATYIAAAAIILTLVWVYQDAGTKKLTNDIAELSQDEPNQAVTDSAQNPDALAVTGEAETMQWPVEDMSVVQIDSPYYNTGASGETKQAAVIEYGDTFTPHVGIDLSREDNQPFNVVAAMSGKVTLVEQNPLVGNVVEITHDDGLVTVYQSLADVTVTKDMEVKQGDIIAKAGRNELEKDLGAHLHFEVRQNGVSVNPEQFLSRSNDQ